MRIVHIGSIAAALAMAAFPAAAQRYYPGYQYYYSYQAPRWSDADERRAHEAAHEAERQAEHARRDAAVGDYHGAAHARLRAHEAYDEAVRHGAYEQGFLPRGYGYGHDADGDHGHGQDE
ncbi:MAG: hypothetical protein M3N26_05305 [Pseudomonadota bacterium]|nr:hypothetical protein [Pseudomonadota bacterium]